MYVLGSFFLSMIIFESVSITRKSGTFQNDPASLNFLWPENCLGDVIPQKEGINPQKPRKTKKSAKFCLIYRSSERENKNLF